MSQITAEVNFHSQVVQAPGDSPGICGLFRFLQRLAESPFCFRILAFDMKVSTGGGKLLPGCGLSGLR
jgi:hypothetical protein